MGARLLVSTVGGGGRSGTGFAVCYRMSSEVRSTGKVVAWGGTGAGSCGNWRHEGRNEPQMCFEGEDG